jgi:hypothetical protein
MLLAQQRMIHHPLNARLLIEQLLLAYQALATRPGTPAHITRLQLLHETHRATCELRWTLFLFSISGRRPQSPVALSDLGAASARGRPVVLLRLAVRAHLARLGTGTATVAGGDD